VAITFLQFLRSTCNVAVTSLPASSSTCWGRAATTTPDGGITETTGNGSLFRFTLRRSTRRGEFYVRSDHLFRPPTLGS